MRHEACNMGSYIIFFWLETLSVLCSSATSPMTSPPQIPQAYALSGGKILLNCTTPDPTGYVSWHRPLDGVQVTRNTAVMSNMRGRLRVIGNHQRGQYNLLVRNVQFPIDNGTWWCSIFGGPRIPTNLLVLVPPDTRVPAVSPISGIVFHVDAQAYTFTCTAHYAHPPVKLSWVKKQGPIMEYNPLPMRVNMAPDYTMSASANLILTPLNHGSVFTCTAEHPTFNGKIFSTDVQFVIADSHYEGMKELRDLEMPVRRMAAGNVAMVIIVVLIIILLVVFSVILWKFRNQWELDIRHRSGYQRVPTMEETNTSNGSVPGADKTDHKTLNDKLRRQFIIKLTLKGVLLLVLVILTSFLVPVYINGYAIPIEGVDQIITVFAGTLLWLDCSSLATQSDDLLVVGWRRNYYKFYNQYNNQLLGNNFGYAINSSDDSYNRGIRTQNHKFGQISVYPAMPDDEGLYICEVARIQDDTGKTSIAMKTFAVGVLTGVPVNKPLIGTALLSLLIAIALIIITLYQSLHRVHNECVKNGTTKKKIKKKENPKKDTDDVKEKEDV